MLKMPAGTVGDASWECNRSQLGDFFKDTTGWEVSQLVKKIAAGWLGDTLYDFNWLGSQLGGITEFELPVDWFSC